MTQLKQLRKEIDTINDDLVSLLARRFQLCREVIKYKHQQNIPMMQPGRVTEVKSRFVEMARKQSIPVDFSHQVISLIIDASCQFEQEILEILKVDQTTPVTSVKVS